MQDYSYIVMQDLLLDVGHCYARFIFCRFYFSDLVDHNFIIGELRNLQVHPAIIRWIKSFLTGREQSVKLATAYLLPPTSGH